MARVKASKITELRNELIEARRLLSERLEVETRQAWIDQVNAKIARINSITRSAKTPVEYMVRMRELAEANYGTR